MNENDKDVLLIIKLGCYLYVIILKWVREEEPYILLDNLDIGLFKCCFLWALAPSIFLVLGIDFNIFISPVYE